MKTLTQYQLQQRNSPVVIFAFIVTILFQVTAYKFIWNIGSISRLLNVVAIVIFSGYSFYAIWKFKFNRYVFGFYIIPGLLVYIGFFINITISSISNISLINQYGLLIPWAIYLAIPYLMKFGKLDALSLWRYFCDFMLVTVSISILEYFLLFSGFITPRPIITSGGPFLAGYFSMLFGTESGELHYRFYSSFMEPGDLAMFLLPAMAYAFLQRKYISLVIFLIAMYMTDSLGGFVGVAMLVPLLAYFKIHKKKFISIILSLFIITIIGVGFSNDFFERYKEKDQSASVREESLSGMSNKVSKLLINYPFGLPLTESTEQAEKIGEYSGSSFTPGNAFNVGGILSFVGYLVILFVSLWYAAFSLFRNRLSIEEQAGVASIIVLLPFIFQRMVVWDSSIFALIFAPYIIRYLQRN